MTLKKAIPVTFIFYGDGASNTLFVDLEKDPYFITQGYTQLTSLLSLNKASNPTGVVITAPPGVTSSIHNNIVTIVLPDVVPLDQLSSCVGNLLF